METAKERVWRRAWYRRWGAVREVRRGLGVERGKHVQGRDVADRPISAADADAHFADETIRVAVMGEQAVVTKEAVLTGEVVLEKERLVERQTVTDTVRRGRVEVDEHYERARGDFQQHFAGHQGTMAAGRTFAQVEPNYRSGFASGNGARYAGPTFDEGEPELRGDHERSGAGGAWEQLRDEVGEGSKTGARAIGVGA